MLRGLGTGAGVPPALPKLVLACYVGRMVSHANCFNTSHLLLLLVSPFNCVDGLRMSRILWMLARDRKVDAGIRVTSSRAEVPGTPTSRATSEDLEVRLKTELNASSQLLLADVRGEAFLACWVDRMRACVFETSHRAWGSMRTNRGRAD